MGLRLGEASLRWDCGSNSRFGVVSLSSTGYMLLYHQLQLRRLITDTISRPRILVSLRIPRHNLYVITRWQFAIYLCVDKDERHTSL